MKRSLFAVTLIVAAFSLSGCSGPSYTIFVNAAAQRLVITYAAVPPATRNSANGSPWFWPLRTDPVLNLGSAYTLTAYCYSCRSQWLVRVRSGACEQHFDIPAVPDDAYVRADWKIFMAYADSAVQLDADNLLYRIPAYAGSSVDVRNIPQPEGYPLSPTSQSGCD